MIESNLLSLSYGRIVRKDITTSDGLLPESFETYQIVDRDDVVFRFTDLQNDKRSLRSALVAERGIITSAYVAVRPKDVEPRFFAYVMRAWDLSKVFYGLGGGVRQSLKFADVARLPVLLPSPGEQRAIADYLDRETAQIDTLIAKQQRLIATLRERRVSAVRSGVTGTFLPGSRRRTTSRFFPDLPDDWRLVPLRRLGDSKAGSGFPPHLQGRTDLELPFFKVKHLAAADSEGLLSVADDYVSRETAAALRATVFPAGTVVYAKVGAALMLGRVRTLATASCLDNNMAGFMPRSDLVGRFLHHAMATIAFDYLVNPGAVPSLSDKNMMAMEIPVPSETVQRAAVDWIDEQTARIDTLIQKSERLIELSQERRAALITAAVTGQIDVRKAA
ncbi:hypothetical protein [Microbacterium sp. Marseille-Q6965]|uniref:hypothetical protein n=1 Tax=Microbacterium sp. Marseille-Q6965 TaxID=2965072 RepID=UPI0021B7FC03|nr:hypothetical protein [Microbacterium sp. Marseille-Q6965]